MDDAAVTSVAYHLGLLQHCKQHEYKLTKMIQHHHLTTFDYIFLCFLSSISLLVFVCRRKSCFPRFY